MIATVAGDDLWGLAVLGAVALLGLLGRWVPGLDGLLWPRCGDPDCPRCRGRDAD